ncbi:hypothetical protein [Lysinibacter cavernae]|uniref:Putative membrane protein n=1 Tax=Lysinibacter cavernae TaxID=1640652 RepID=A0A7X5TSK6_9MICO|nr:hypothetical protein [Lysinibacter cavernae]NIH52328.1 putative membrane protein [Lysinibacter cavernae]
MSTLQPSSELPHSSQSVLVVDAPNAVDQPVPLGVRLFMGLVTVMLGVLLGILTTVQHQVTTVIGEVRLPTGVVLGLVAFGSVALLSRMLNPGIARAVQLCAGVMIAVALFSSVSLGGSVLIPNNPVGWVWLIGTLVVSACAVLWPRRRERTRQEPQGDKLEVHNHLSSTENQ